jgi:RNA polymerase sigma-70 factor (ECF subfamily)
MTDSTTERDPPPADREWLERLWQAYGDRLFAYAARRVGPDQADDVVADVFLVAWRHRRARPRRELPWLYGVAHNMLSEHYRAVQRWDHLVERARQHVRQQEDDGTGLEVLAVAGAIGQLSPDDREALLLTAWENLEPREAAAVVGIPAATFRMRLTRARRRLRRLMSQGDVSEGTPSRRTP